MDLNIVSIEQKKRYEVYTWFLPKGKSYSVWDNVMFKSIKDDLTEAEASEEVNRLNEEG